MYKALVIGCGNIGAMYDFENDKIQTHVKALVNHGDFDVYVFDTNSDLSQKVAQKYQISVQNSLNQLQDFDLICICSPTPTHIQYLKKCLENSTKVVICEKPISNDDSDLESFTKEKRGNSQTKILVNYMRPFLPQYKIIQDEFRTILKSEQPSQIIVKYYKGIINYASHALNLLEFLMNKEFTLKEARVLQKEYDFFSSDPTMTIWGLWDNTPLQLIGFTNTNFAIFEIEIYFKNYKILINNSGDTVEIYHQQTHIFQNFPKVPIKKYEECLKNYMKYVILQAYELLENPSLEDNFDQSNHLNQYLLHLIAHETWK